MRWKKCCAYFALVIFVCVSVRAFFELHLDLSDDDFTGVEMCPACYGTSLCPEFYHGDIELLGISQWKCLQFLNQKNVFTAKLHREQVVLKKLAHNWELTDADAHLCKIAKLENHCKVNEAVKLLVKSHLKADHENSLLNVLNSFKSSTDISQCPSERLLSYIFSKLNSDYKAINKIDYMKVHKIAEMMYSILINPEAIILQSFSQAEGWPFPHFHGSCGRVIVEEFVGKSLGSYEDSPWEVRVDIAYQLLLISQMLTENVLNFALYMTDVRMDNFALRMDGTVLLIDVENIVIVDRLKVKKGVSFHQSTGEFCSDCLSFSFEDLCSHTLSDHNYYAVCRGLLVGQGRQGLLHSIPSDVDHRTNLSALLHECAHPSAPLGRFRLMPQLLQTLNSLL